MTKIPATNFTATGLQFVYSTDDADAFDRDEVNLPAQALDQHTHADTLGLPVMRLGSGVQAAGPMLLADGAAATPSLAFQNAPTTGLFQSGGALHITSGGTDRWQVNASGHLLAATDNALDIGASGTSRPRNVYLAGLLDAPVLTPTGNVLEQRNSTNAQTLRLYNTYTDAANYERLTLWWTTNVADLRLEVAGSGVASRNLQIGTMGAGTLSFYNGGTVRWQINGGNLLPLADNTYDIGAGGNSVRTLYVNAITKPNNSVPLVIFDPGGYKSTDFRQVGSPQRIRVYGSYTNDSNNDYVTVDGGTSGNIEILAYKNGTGTSRGLTFGTGPGGSDIYIRRGGTDYWQINTFGYLVPVTDNAVSLGYTGQRINTLYLGTDIYIGRNLIHEAGGAIGFFGTTQTPKKTVTGAKAGNAALTSLLTQLAAYGLITDSTT